jgi:hypothetical protein
MKQAAILAFLFLAFNIFSAHSAHAEALTGSALTTTAQNLSVVFKAGNNICHDNPNTGWASDRLENAIADGISKASVIEINEGHKVSVVSTNSDASQPHSFIRMDVTLSDDSTSVKSLNADIIKLIDGASATAAKVEHVLLHITCTEAGN